MFTTLLLSVHQAQPVPKLTPSPRWQNLGKAARPRSLVPWTDLPRRLSSMGLLKKKLMLTRKWPLMPLSP